LARVYVALERREDAIAVLRGALSGGVLDPEARDYRDALVELGRVHHEAGNYLAAVERLDEARQRYAEDERTSDILYRLADASRHHALDVRMRATADLAHAPQDAERLEAIAASFLIQARDLYADVVHRDAVISGRQPERSLLRNAMRFRADCAFALSDYTDAIELYDQVARRFPDHYAAVHALIQIHNAYVALGDEEGARASQLRARRRLAVMPDDAFEDPAALLDREAWERWLATSPLGYVTEATSSEP